MNRRLSVIIDFAVVLAGLVTCACACSSSMVAAFRHRTPCRDMPTNYLITFGNSYTSTGFQFSQDAPSATNPIGNPPFPGKTNSGGYNWVDHVVTEFNSSLLLSYNLAFPGATTNASILPPFIDIVLTFVDQVAEFKKSYLNPLPWSADNVLVGSWMGVNDVANSWTLNNVTSMYEEIMNSQFGGWQDLYAAGARNFMVFSLPPLDRTPFMVMKTKSEQAQISAAIETFNRILTARFNSFAAINKGVIAKMIITTPLFNKALADPISYGAPDNTCFNSDGKSCLWYDNFHPGIAIQQLVAAEVAKTWHGTFFRSK